MCGTHYSTSFAILLASRRGYFLPSTIAISSGVSLFSRIQNKIKLSVWIIDSILLPSKVKPFDCTHFDKLSASRAGGQELGG
jgi:hypothetical protein